MPRKSKVTAVPVEQAVEPANAVEEAPRTDAEEMTDLVKVIATGGAGEDDKIIIAEAPLEPEEPVVTEPKAKPKRASRAKAKAVSLEATVTTAPELEETEGVEVEVPKEVSKEVNKEAKVAEKVSCPDCGKQMSAKTLKYSHGPNCLVKKKEADQREHGGPNIPEEMIEELVQSRMNNVKKERLAKREQALEKLVAGALP